ncbi:conserved unknown protein [Ectocarpus siliculosus]|uniref:Uncharacterized protein n=1 Tax=Ectocarpus siliculosus TaxID=2880 RepID=D7FHI1_ECTSI|nr:conserved unknown protein [Ectocarpus siliculosus]|eukprot:CBJ28543.1 conserved unknown protein [Ectocarpus siliculosus]
MGVEGRWRVSQHPVTSIEQHPGDSRVGRSLPAGSGMSPLLLTSVGSGSDSEALLWKALGGTDVNPEDADQQLWLTSSADRAGRLRGDSALRSPVSILLGSSWLQGQQSCTEEEEQPLFRWQGLRAARFDHGGTRAAAVVYPQIGGLGEDQRYNQTWGAQVLDVETGSVLARLWDARSRPLYPLPNVGFNATDDLVVTDGALWDPRRGLRVYQFDKLGGGGGFGLFHPNGNEVVVDEGVWDLRTHRLLRTLPCQDGTVMKPDPGGDVLYTYKPAPAGDFFDLPQKRAAQDTCFGVLDSSTYDQIHSHDTEKAVIQLSTDDGGGDGSCISVVERADPLLNTVDTVCSLYEIGRKRPDEADSDLDDAMSEDSDEEWEDADHSDGGDDLLEDGRSRWTARGGSSGDSDDILVDGGSSGSDGGSDDGAGTSSGSESDIFQSLLRRRGGGAVYDAASASGSSSTDDWLARRRENRRRIARRRGEVSSTDDSNEEDDSDEEEEDDDDEEEKEN